MSDCVYRAYRELLHAVEPAHLPAPRKVFDTLRWLYQGDKHALQGAYVYPVLEYLAKTNGLKVRMETVFPVLELMRHAGIFGHGTYLPFKGYSPVEGHAWKLLHLYPRNHAGAGLYEVETFSPTPGPAIYGDLLSQHAFYAPSAPELTPDTFLVWRANFFR